MRRRMMMASWKKFLSLGDIIDAYFSSGENGIIYIPEPVIDGSQVLFQDSVGATPVTADGDLVGRMLDLSGNGQHATQTDNSLRPTYRTDGVLHWLEFSLNDRLTASIDTFGVYDYCMGYVPNGDNFMVTHRAPSNTGAWVGVGAIGSSDTSLTDSRGTQLAMYFDAVLSGATTRGGQHTLAQSANSIITNYNLTDSGQSFRVASIGGYFSFRVPGALHGYILREGTLGEGGRQDVSGFLARLSGANI